MLNDIDFDFVDFGIPNLGWAKSKAIPPSKPVRLANKLEPLAYEAAKKFPKWVFRGAPQWGYDDHMEVAKLSVYENREKIGTLSINTTRIGAKYVISSDRITSTRKRGDGAQTGDTNKALALMAKHFGGKTTIEKVEAARSALYRGISGSNMGKHTAYTQAKAVLVKHLDTYIFDNFEAVSAAAIAAGADVSVLGLPKAKEDFDTTNKIDKALVNTGVLVLLNGSDYIIQEQAGDETLVLSSDTLPSALKGKLGMLKLLEDNHFMKDVGYRLNATTFYVLAEPG